MREVMKTIDAHATLHIELLVKGSGPNENYLALELQIKYAVCYNELTRNNSHLPPPSLCGRQIRGISCWSALVLKLPPFRVFTFDP
ncbi:hypothetical protein NPIL_215321 [Nephila pilipes]|uniref:Uncharacterized protein n=1 Tax=Nephila pilipes TaxID=299642 RepID=A0A8X6NYS7_NEPPI|nr:hypothetical protein NPIL_215321 [Nephila pilipes]